MYMHERFTIWRLLWTTIHSVYSTILHDPCSSLFLLSSASKSKPASSAPDIPSKEKDKVPLAPKHQDDAPSTPTKTEKEKKEKPSKKKEKSKGAPVLPPVEAKPPPGPLVALGRRDKPLKRPRSVERDLVSLSYTLFHVSSVNRGPCLPIGCHVILCMCVLCVCVLLHASRLDHGLLYGGESCIYTHSAIMCSRYYMYMY